MLIVCPSCASEYTIDPAKVGAEGRTVRCASCRTKWWVGPPDEASWDEEPIPEPSPPVPAEQPPLSVEATSARSDAPPRPPRKPRGPRSPRRQSALVRAIGAVPPAPALAILWLATLIGAVAGRAGVVQAFPETARLYAGVGLPVNMRGIEIRDVRSEVTGSGAEAFLTVEGELRGVGPSGSPVPPIRVAVQDDTATPFYTWTVEAPKETLSPGETVRFRARLAAPPPEGKQVFVRFATGDKGGR